MAWELSSWLVLARTFQLLGALACGGLNGWLVGMIYTRKLGLSQSMVILELLVCIMLVYTTLAMIIQHTGKRSRSTSWLVAFVVLDILFCALDVGIITILARAGLPSNCAGLTRLDYSGDDSTRRPAPGYSTIRFSDESGLDKGELDKYCAYERSYYFIAVGIIFLYIASIVFAVLRICLKKYENYINPSVGKGLLDPLGRAEEGDKALELSPLSSTPKLAPIAPPSEGIITRNTSVRSTMTSSTNNPYRNSGAIRRVPVPPPQPPLPPRTLTRLSMPGPEMGNAVGLGFVGATHDEDEDIAAEALVADGMQHRTHQERQLRMPMLLEEDQTAESALVSDGMRPNEPMLPPYEPGSSRMAGHGSESNEIRLSEYVKGGTRAQAMKDSGRY